MRPLLSVVIGVSAAVIVMTPIPTEISAMYTTRARGYASRLVTSVSHGVTPVSRPIPATHSETPSDTPKGPAPHHPDPRLTPILWSPSLLAVGGLTALAVWLWVHKGHTRGSWGAASTAARKDWVRADIGGLRKEVDRHLQRCFKKIAKAQDRLLAAEREVDRLLSTDAPLGALETAPDTGAIAAEVAALQDRLRGLQRLEAELRSVNGPLSDPLLGLIASLGVTDAPPDRPPRSPPKPKGPKSVAPRKPYQSFTSADALEIRVGRSAADNDVLSLDPDHRDPADWWMHASGCPGSHVVIRCTDPAVPAETLRDAAALAARHSKAGAPHVRVTLVRCRQVSKPPGAKPGLVRLSGSTQTIEVDLKKDAPRLARLDATTGS